ncbi:MAG TPA: lipopolysaccharide assembly protein LapA domain-containing protein [Thermodesulfobacteriota bacterium]|nr:lipopolysaccharide assembly protein LapA domain-containing protein [Thermodesulfobacteriota bacterium]
MRWIKTLLTIPILAIVILFCNQNQELVTLRLLLIPVENYHWFEIPRVSLPLFVVVLLSVLLGVLIGVLGDVYHWFRLKTTLRKNQKKVEMLEREIQSLRGPVQGQPSALNKEG